MLSDSELHANVPASDLKRHCAESPTKAARLVQHEQCT
jgi:hypothetical protein